MNNLVDEPLAEDMNLTATDFPSGKGEPAEIGLLTAPSMLVRPPRLAAAPAAFECRRTLSMAFGSHRELLIGEVIGARVREGIVDPVSLSVDFTALRPVGRLCGSSYARQRELFELKRISYAEWREKRRARHIKKPRLAPRAGAREGPWGYCIAVTEGASRTRDVCDRALQRVPQLLANGAAHSTRGNAPRKTEAGRMCRAESQPALLRREKFATRPWT